MFAVYFASDRSSSGKSTVTLAFSMALKDMGYSLSAYKAGPDFIDTAILSKALKSEIPVKNLDPFLIPHKHLKKWFFSGNETAGGRDRDVLKSKEYENNCKKKAFIVESAMGLYDGNSYIIAKEFKLPVVLVMDCKRISSTMASLVYGLKNYKKGVNVCGVILNNISSKRHYEIISEEIRVNIPDIKVFGWILKDEDVFSIKERHLGLTVHGDESGNGKKSFKKIVSGITEGVFKNVDFNILVKTLKENSTQFNKLFQKNTESKKNLDVSVLDEPKKTNNRIKNKIKSKIAVALDKAFFFYYNFNLEILKSFGAEIVFFSPLRDKSLPNGTRAIYIGGGYPEIYAGALAENVSVRKEIYEFFKNNGIIYAECGGLMYLCRKIIYKKQSFAATGIFPFDASMDIGRLSLGYRTVRFKEKTFLGEAGLTVNGHEFHYSTLLNDDGLVVKNNKYPENVKNIFEYESASAPGIFKPEGYNVLNAIGSYIHLSFYSNKLPAKNIVAGSVNF